MALSKELKAYINKKFDEKIKNTRIAKDNATCKYRREEEAKIKKEISKELDLEHSAFVSKLHEVKDKYGDSILYRYTLKNLMAESLESMLDPQVDITKIVKPFDDEVIALNKQRDTLLIQLSMEKDFERIKEILKENGIGL